MALPDSLLAVAGDLCALDPGRPRQASLRRSVSTMYYALFHLLAGDVALRMCAGDAALAAKAFRDFTHTGIRSVIDEALAPTGNRPPRLAALLGATPLSPDLHLVCRAFADAHSERESADYDLGRRYDRLTAALLLDQVRLAFAAWRAVRGTPQGQQFVMALILFARGRAR